MERAMDYGRLMQSLEGLRHSNGKVGRSLDYIALITHIQWNTTTVQLVVLLVYRVQYVLFYIVKDVMAAMMASPPKQPVPPSQPQLNPSRNPLPLSASQESQVRELYHKRVRNKCADEVRGQYLSAYA